jgi:Cys-rich four helix bundle protein (predicted Tat secretion target)
MFANHEENETMKKPTIETDASLDPAAAGTFAAGDRLLDRRTLLAGTGALAGVLAGGVTLAATGEAGHHGMHGAAKSPALHAAVHCSEQASSCLAHCLSMFEEGDTSLAECATSVNQMTSLCDALAAQLTTQSKYVRSMAAVCGEACSDCEAVCRKHADKHEACRSCADACADLLAAIKTLSTDTAT